VIEEQVESRDSERRALIEFVQKEAARTRDFTDETLRAEACGRPVVAALLTHSGAGAGQHGGGV
jgi:hypothetical protein